MPSIQTVLLQAAHQLQSASPSPRLDAELLLAWVLNTSREFLYTHSQQPLSEEVLQQYCQLIERRKTGEPIAYLLGKKAFWNVELKVTPATLIPRPETELLVELALEQLPAGESLNVADLGTGSGAIALALAKERPQWQLFAVDNSVAALSVARQNAQELLINNVVFLHGNWCQALPDKNHFEAIISNPPYIDAKDPHLESLTFEPQTALVAAEQGLQDIQTIISQARDYLITGGKLLLEHGYDQATVVQAMLAEAGYSNIITYRDFAGIERVTVAVWCFPVS